jgi:hypothetical protein
MAPAYTGVTVNGSTGIITVTSSATAGIAYIRATNGYVDQIRPLALISDSQTQIEALVLDISVGSQYLVSVKCNGVPSLTGRQFTVKYDPNALVAVDLCAFSKGKVLSAGLVPGTSLTVESFTPGEIIFSLAKSIPSGKTWDGVVNVMRFKAIQKKATILHVK